MTNQVPDTERAETLLGLAQVGLGDVPVLGGVAPELLDVALGLQVERRRIEWLNSLAERLAKLEKQVEGFRVTDLVDHPAVISACSKLASCCGATAQTSSRRSATRYLTWRSRRHPETTSTNCLSSSSTPSLVGI